MKIELVSLGLCLFSLVLSLGYIYSFVGGSVSITIPREATMTFSNGTILKAIEGSQGNLIIEELN